MNLRSAANDQRETSLEIFIIFQISFDSAPAVTKASSIRELFLAHFLGIRISLPSPSVSRGEEGERRGNSIILVLQGAL